MALTSEMQKRLIVFSASYGQMDNGLHWGSATVYSPSNSKEQRPGSIGSPVNIISIEPAVARLLSEMPLPCLVRFGFEDKPVKKKSGAAGTELVAVECEVIPESIGKFQAFATDLFKLGLSAPSGAVSPPVASAAPVGMTINAPKI